MGTWQLTMRGKLDDVAIENVWYYLTSFDDYSSAYEIGDALNAVYKTWIEPDLSAAFEMYQAQVRRVGAPGYPTVPYVPVGMPWNGNAITEALPANVCVMVQWTAISLFPRTTRKYLSGYTEGAWGGVSQWSGAIISAAESFAANCITLTLPTAGFAQLVAAKWAPDNSYVSAVNPVTAYVVKNFPASQQRRRIDF